LIFQYSRVQQMYPILEPIPLGKILYVICLLGILISRRLPRVKSPMASGIDALVVLFVLAHFFSAIGADYRLLALAGCVDAASWLVTYFVISRTLSSTWRLRIFVILLLLLNLKLAQFSVRSYFQALGAGRSEQFLSVHGVGAGSTDFFGNAGDFGVAMCVVWPLAGALLFGEKKWLVKILWAICFLFFFAAILACGSRGALVGAAVIALVAWASKPKKVAGMVMTAVLLLGFFYALPQANKDRLASALHYQSDETASLRIDFWKAGLRMFEDHPLLGVGPRNFPPEYAYSYARTPVDPNSGNDTNLWAPHSIYIQSLSQLGALGTLPLLLIFLLYFGVNFKTRRHLKNLALNAKTSFEMRLSRGLDLAMVGYMVSGAFLTVLYYPHLWFLLGINLGLHRTCMRKQKKETEVEIQFPGRMKSRPPLVLSARGG
jgi:O-antigen ligase